MIPTGLKKRLLKLIAGGASAVVLALAMTQQFESSNKPHLTPYRDTGGIWTVCDGVTGPAVVPGKTYTPGECATLDNRAMATAQAAVDRLVKVPISTTEKAALLDFTRNQGAGALASSTLLRKLNAGDRAGACREYNRWVYGRVNGKMVKLKNQIDRREVATWLCSMH
jgi:lysozyme